MSKVETHARSIAKQLKAIAATGQVGRAADVFNDFIQSIFNMIADPAMMDSVALGRGMSVRQGWRVELKKYAAHPAAWKMLGAACTEYGRAVASCPPFSDILGAICAEYGDPSLGQFLSPIDLADLMAGILGAIHSRENMGGPTSVSDETGCGAGGLILAHSRRVHASEGAAGIARLRVFVNDLDASMVKACCVQIAMPLFLKQMKLGSFKASCCNVMPNANPSDSHLVYEHGSVKGREDIGGLIDRLRMAAAAM